MSIDQGRVWFDFLTPVKHGEGRASVGFLAVEELLEQLLDLRDAGGAADQHHVPDVLGLQLALLQHVPHGVQCLCIPRYIREWQGGKVCMGNFGGRGKSSYKKCKRKIIIEGHVGP